MLSRFITTFREDGLHLLALADLSLEGIQDVRTVADAFRVSPHVQLAQTMLTRTPTAIEDTRRSLVLRRGVLMPEATPKRYLVQQADPAVDAFATQPALFDALRSLTDIPALAYYGGHLWVALVPPANYQPFMSQTWHRDPYDGTGNRIVKLFWYLDDVDRDNGPFEYIGGSRELTPPTGLSALDRYIEPRHWSGLRAHPRRIVCTGPADTLILCDTSGIHRGGLCTTRQRLSVTMVYTA